MCETGQVIKQFSSSVNRISGMNATYHGRTGFIYSLVYICYLFTSVYAVYFN
jgi:hypothetical protein